MLRAAWPGGVEGAGRTAVPPRGGVITCGAGLPRGARAWEGVMTRGGPARPAPHARRPRPTLRGQTPTPHVWSGLAHPRPPEQGKITSQPLSAAWSPLFITPHGWGSYWRGHRRPRHPACARRVTPAPVEPSPILTLTLASTLPPDRAPNRDPGPDPHPHLNPHPNPGPTPSLALPPTRTLARRCLPAEATAQHPTAREPAAGG